jgi:hypothetical protein
MSEQPIHRSLTIQQTLDEDGSMETHISGENIGDLLAALGILHGATDVILTKMMKEKMEGAEDEPKKPNIIVPDFGIGGLN